MSHFTGFSTQRFAVKAPSGANRCGRFLILDHPFLLPKTIIKLGVYIFYVTIFFWQESIFVAGGVWYKQAGLASQMTQRGSKLDSIKKIKKSSAVALTRYLRRYNPMETALWLTVAGGIPVDACRNDVTPMLLIVAGALGLTCSLRG